LNEDEEAEEEEEKPKTEEELVWFYYHSTFKILKDMVEYFLETNPGLLEKKIEIEKVTAKDRLKKLKFGKVLGQGTFAIVYACKDEQN
jgi:hypothetical protein